MSNQEPERNLRELEEKYTSLKNDFNESLKRIAILEQIIDKYQNETKVDSIDLLVKCAEDGILNFPKIGISKSRLGGNGVFAKDKIKRGEAIELTPFIVCFKRTLDLTPLIDYYFTIDEPGEGILCGVLLGYGMIYNHSDEPTAHWILNTERKEVLFIANRDIEPGGEITINYGSDYWDSPGRKGEKII
jgi:hypothetical protein